MKTKLVFFLSMLYLPVSAQVFKPFKVNLAVGYALPGGSAGKGGFAYSLEPRYGLGDHLDIGVRLEQAFLAQSIRTVGNSTNADLKALTSGSLTATYLLGTGNVRPFVGLGAGVYGVGATNVTFTTNTGSATTTDQYYIKSDTKFGVMLRAGVKANHLTLSAEYNALGTSVNRDFAVSVERQNSYVGFKAGVDLGGGRR